VLLVGGCTAVFKVKKGKYLMYVNSPWRTDNLSLAAFLSIELEVDPEIQWEGSYCFFVFENDEELHDVVAEYVSGRCRVEPQSFSMAHGKLKRTMFENKEAPHPSRSRRPPRSERVANSK
jgi:hypothetical protein